ncbi:MAG: ribosomal-processing cysteine protease Prp [Spirochaetaceae bacterium]|nr:MAG: ribosomal-processing cysteine protease Prp [Spirochaetaceae bacterium]
MIRVTVHTRKGELVRIIAEGHAHRGPGELSAACGAVSAVLKGLGLSLLDQPDCTVEGSVESEGRYDLTIRECANGPWLTGTWDLARAVLGEIAREWSRDVVFTISEE